MAVFTGSPVSTDSYAGAATQGPAFVTSPWNVSFGKWNHTATQGPGTGEVNLLVLPPGKIAIDSSKSRLVTTAFAAGADLHIGFRAHETPELVATAEDDNYFADNLDAASAIDVALPLPVDPISHFNTRRGLKIYAMVDTGNIEDTDTISLWVVWRHEG